MTKTTYILAGGNDRQVADYGSRLGEEIAKHVTNPKILSCFYSQREETWEEKAEDWHDWFSQNFSWPFSYAYTRLDTLLDQIDQADVIYFHGGDTQLLLRKLPNTETLQKHFSGKIVIGSSAGANMLARHFWSSSRSVYGEGKGLLDISIMVHYGATKIGDSQRTAEDWEQQEKQFASMVNMPIAQLPEGQFSVYKKG